MSAPRFLDVRRHVGGGSVSRLAILYEGLSTELLVKRGEDIDVILYHAWRAGGDERVGHIYFIQSENSGGPIKIGWAKNVTQRMADLQIGNHTPLALRAKFRAPRGMERTLHLIFDHCHIRGEWFRLADPLDQLIRRINACVSPM